MHHVVWHASKSTPTVDDCRLQNVQSALDLPPADLQPSEVGLVAVHGTGTPLGDPIEVGALGQALTTAAGFAANPGSGNGNTVGGNGSGGGFGHRLALASVKSCYGHTEGAAGLTGALLAVSSLQAQVSCPPSEHTSADDVINCEYTVEHTVLLHLAWHLLFTSAEVH